MISKSEHKYALYTLFIFFAILRRRFKLLQVTI
jgi:hypothetical protein